MEFNLKKSVDSWIQYVDGVSSDKDLVIFFENEDDAIWFSSNYGQRKSVLGGCEVVTVCGLLVKNIKDFAVQINVSLPSSYRISGNYHSLYDVLLNFETEPKYREIIWCDAQHLLEYNLKDFIDISDLLLESAYLNRTGQSTIKDDGTPYKVGQRNVFVFSGVEICRTVLAIMQADFVLDVESSPPFKVIRVDKFGKGSVVKVGSVTPPK